MNKKKMKKYYLQGTAEELEIGDMIELDLTEDLPNGKVKHHHLECKFIPPIIPLLLEEGIIEVQEVKEKKPKAPKKEKKPTALDMIDKLAEQNMRLTSKMDVLEQIVKRLSLLIAYNVSPTNGNKPRRNAKKAGRKQED